jgi:hypothetical protein
MDRTVFTKPRAKISQSAAVTRAWQDAALAKQLINQRKSSSDRAISKRKSSSVCTVKCCS